MNQVNKPGNIWGVEFLMEGTANAKVLRLGEYLACSRKGKMPVSYGQSETGKRG